MTGRRLRGPLCLTLTALLAVSLSLLLTMAMVRHGAHGPAIVAESFEGSGYYEEETARVRETALAELEEAGLPVTALDMEVYLGYVSRRLRDQVYGRRTPEGAADGPRTEEALAGWLEEQGLPLTDRAGIGLKSLAGRLDREAAEGTRIPGLRGWQEARERLWAGAAAPMCVLAVLSLAEALTLLAIRWRRQDGLRLTAAGLLLSAPAAGMLLCLLKGYGPPIFLDDFVTPATACLEEALAAYQKGVALACLRMEGGVLLAGLLLWLVAAALRKGR